MSELYDLFSIASSQGGGGDAQNEVKSTRFHPQMDKNASTRSEMQRQAQFECVLDEYDVVVSSKRRYYVISSQSKRQNGRLSAYCDGKPQCRKGDIRTQSAQNQRSPIDWCIVLYVLITFTAAASRTNQTALQKD